MKHGENRVRCTRCTWEGREQDLASFIDYEEVAEFKKRPAQCRYPGCPNCRTDQHLENLPALKTENHGNYPTRL